MENVQTKTAINTAQEKETEWAYLIMINCDSVMNHPVAIFSEEEEASEFRRFVLAKWLHEGTSHSNSVSIHKIPFNPKRT